MYSINRKKPVKIRKYLIYPVAEGVVLAVVAVLLTSVTAFFIYHHALTAIKAEIKDGLLRTASGIAACLDGDTISSFDAPEKKDLPEYQATLKLLQNARLATKHCTYLYVNKMVGKKVVFILDPTPVDENGKPLFTDEMNLAPSVPLTEYQEPSQELITALTEQKKVVSEEPYQDKWGIFYSAYVPIFDKNKNFVGTLGADLRIDDMLARCKPIEEATKRAFFVSFILAIMCGTLIWFARRFSLQLNQSRFEILDNLKDAAEFADQTAIKIGRQLQRISLIIRNLASRIKEIAGTNDNESQAALLNAEYKRLISFSEKVAEAGELKSSRLSADLINFKIAQVQENISLGLQKNDLDASRLEFSIDPHIPDEIYGSARTFEELLAQMSSFFLKTFSGKVNCSIKMLVENARDLTLEQFMTAETGNLDPEKVKLLQQLCQEADKEDFFTQLELAEAATISILRELVYLFNSDISVEMDAKEFKIGFSSMFQKSLEEDDESDPDEDNAQENESQENTNA